MAEIDDETLARMDAHVAHVERLLPTPALREAVIGFMGGLVYPLGLYVTWALREDGVYHWRVVREDPLAYLDRAGGEER